MKKFFSSLILCLSVSSAVLASSGTSQVTPAPAPAPAPAGAPTRTLGTIERTTKQQIIATIHPDTPDDPPTPFLTSPSGKYAAFLLRTKTAPTAGGFGNDFCYVQIQDSETKQSLWESECTPISTANACALVFDDDGLTIFDGSTPEWDTGAESADNNPLERVELVDEGDMYIRDKIGELAWRASDDPRVNQKCGEPGSPGLGPALPPFAQPIGGGQGNFPFGQGGGVVSTTGAGQTFGFGGGEQPLVDSTAFGSGSERGSRSWSGILGWALVACWLIYGCVF